jgi:perosamine synthetase
MSRDEFQTALAKRGIETAVHYPLPLHRQPIFRGCGSDPDFPVRTRLAETVLSLPVHPGLSHQDLSYLVRCVREVAGSAARA